MEHWNTNEDTNNIKQTANGNIFEHNKSVTHNWKISLNCLLVICKFILANNIEIRVRPINYLSLWD